MFYEEVFRELNKNKVKYVVAGGIAVNLHGVPRTTWDMDILIDFDKENMNRFSNAMKSLGYKPKIPVTIEDFGIAKNRESWVKEKEMKVFSLWNTKDPYKIIDVFVQHPIAFKELYRKKKDVSVGEFKIPVVSIEHLIELKNIAARLQDISDIESLQKVKKLKRGRK